VTVSVSVRRSNGLRSRFEILKALGVSVSSMIPRSKSPLPSLLTTDNRPPTTSAHGLLNTSAPTDTGTGTDTSPSRLQR
jgi:hypothetical protein